MKKIKEGKYNIFDWCAQRYTYEDFPETRRIYDYDITLPPKPPKETIANYGLPKKDQKFTPFKIPNGYTFWTQKKQDEYIEEMWNYRFDGYWFFNNGYLEYITGLHWFYICYWYFPVVIDGKKRRGLPSFTDSDRDHFYVWHFCYVDPKCFGMLEITNRRDGKSERGLCTGYEEVTRNPDAKMGIQSKNSADGKKLFLRLVKAWQKLPYFWRPVHSGETHPQAVLRFEEPGTKDTKSKGKKYKRVLNSQIDFGTAREEHYDGDYLTFYYHDEIGKCSPKEARVDVRWETVKECQADGSMITGKSLHTTTVEEMEKKGGKYCKTMWDESDYNELNELGQTLSGLYRYFKPAYYGFCGGEEDGGVTFIDEYGYSDCERAWIFLNKRRAALKGASINSQRRKYPFVEADCFIVDNKFTPFDTDRIYEQIDYNSGLPAHIVQRGNFVWKERDKEVAWNPTENGRWTMTQLPEDGLKNKSGMVHGIRVPGNTTIYACGTDPFDHKKTVNNKQSDAASHVKKKFDPMNPDDSNFLVCQYLFRPPTPEMFYEDMVMQCVYYGTDMLAETNRPGLVNYFRQRGYSKYLMKRPEVTQTKYSQTQKEPGIPMSGDAARNALVDQVVSEVFQNIGYLTEQDEYSKCYFDELLYQLIDFETDNWTPYDLVVSYGLTLLAERKNVSKRSLDRPKHKLVQLYNRNGRKIN